MPFIVEAVKGGYKVRKDVPGPAKYYSKKPLSKDTAEKQRRAIYLHEKKKM